MIGTSRIAVTPLVLALVTVASWAGLLALVGGWRPEVEGWDRVAITLLALVPFQLAYAAFVASAVISHWPTGSLSLGARLGVWLLAIAAGATLAWFLPQSAPIAATGYLLWHIAHRIRVHRRLGRDAHEALLKAGP